jgi:uncharacterized damage-inducible protein DinB
MNIADIQLMYDYNDWANKKLLAQAALVTPEQFIAPTDHSWGSLRGTLVHTMDTEYGWRLILQNPGEWNAPELNPDDFPTAASVQEHWNGEDAAWRAYLGSLTDADVDRTIRYFIPEGFRDRVVWHCIWHVINHGMQHRAEAAHMLTNYGHSPGELDFTQYMNWRNGIV